jgi:orotate phosphoribosyltransferase-like protein
MKLTKRQGAQMCNRIYEDMINRRDHYVSDSDVRRSVDTICSEESISTFQHFWTDGIFEGGADLERLQYLNAMILITCAKLCTHSGDAVDLEALKADINVRRHDSAHVHYRINNLLERQVLAIHDGRLRIRVPLLGAWLLGTGSTSVKSSFGERDFEAILAPELGVSSRDIVEMSKGLSYQGEVVNEIRIRAWLEQFGNKRNQELALDLLRDLKMNGYFDDAKIYQMSKALHSVVVTEQVSSGDWAQVVKGKKPTNVFVSHFATDGKSGSSVLYHYRNANSLPPQLTGSIDEAVAFLARVPNSVLIVVDDMIGTGQTVLNGLRALDEKLKAAGGKAKPVAVYATALVGFRTGIETVRREAPIECKVLVSREFDETYRAFSPNSRRFRSEADRIDAEQLCRNIGEVLEPRHPSRLWGFSSVGHFQPQMSEQHTSDFLQG